MRKNVYHSLLFRFLAFSMILLLSVTPVAAADAQTQQTMEPAAETTTEIETDETETTEEIEEPATEDTTETLSPEDITEEDTEEITPEDETTEEITEDNTEEETTETEDISDPEEEKQPSQPVSRGKRRASPGLGDAFGIATAACTVSMKATGTGLTIEGSIPSQYTKKPYYYTFGQFYIDGVVVKDFTNATTIPRQTISLSQFGTGYHTAVLFVRNKNESSNIDALYKTYIPYNGITAKPGYKGVLDVYSKYFFYYPYNMAMQNQAGDLYLEYSANNGKTWKRYGAMRANAIKLYTEQGYTIKGLKPNKKYKIRIRYGTYVTYEKAKLKEGKYLGDGKSHFFAGPPLYVKTIKTGKKKPPKIKSIKVKAIKVKYHKVRHYGYYTGVYLYTEKFYTCKFRVTVKLKKKPGTKGIWLNGRYLKGNKKTYSTTFTPYPNYYTKKPPRGLKKYVVQIASFRSKAYGGFSPLKKKKVKIR